MFKKNKTIKYTSKDLAFIERHFLNHELFHSSASACLKIINDYSEDEYYGSFYISDCHRTIDLTIDLDTLEGLENSINKLKTLEKICKNGIKHLKKMKLYAFEPEKENESDKKKDLLSIESESKK